MARKRETLDMPKSLQEGTSYLSFATACACCLMVDIQAYRVHPRSDGQPYSALIYMTRHIIAIDPDMVRRLGCVEIRVAVLKQRTNGAIAIAKRRGKVCLKDRMRSSRYPQVSKEAGTRHSKDSPGPASHTW